MKELGIGIIGFGFMGKTHTFAYKNIPFYYPDFPANINLKGVCSRHIENAESAKEAFGFEYATDNYMDIIEDKEIDIVNICTPNAQHKEQVIAALRAGKHIYCDKPLAISYSEAQEILAEKEKSKSICQITLQNRFFPATIRAKQLIGEGRLGRILSFRACYLHSGAIDPDRPISWRMDISQGGGGVLFDMGIHVLDAIYSLIGEFESIFCKTQTIYKKRPDKTGKMVDISVDDASYMVLTAKCGAVGTVEASKVASGTNDELRFEIHGDRGALRFNLMEPNFLEYYDNTKGDMPYGGDKGFTKIECVQRYENSPFPGPKYAVGWTRGHIHSLYSFLNCVLSGKSASPSFEDGAYLQYVMEKGYESAKSGKMLML